MAAVHIFFSFDLQTCCPFRSTIFVAEVGEPANSFKCMMSRSNWS